MEERMTFKQVALYALKWTAALLLTMAFTLAMVAFLWLADDMGCQM